ESARAESMWMWARSTAIAAPCRCWPADRSRSVQALALAQCVPMPNLNPEGGTTIMLTQQPERTEEFQQRIEELGPWFHNLRLAGVETAPNHFLGDYPAIKFAGFRDVIPQDLSGATVLDIGCNAGFYS